MKTKYMAFDIPHDEVYDAVKLKAIADVASHFRISNEEADAKLQIATIDNPIQINDCELWTE